MAAEAESIESKLCASSETQYSSLRNIIHYHPQFRMHMKTETVQVKIAARRDLPPSGKAMEVSSGERMLCVVNLDGEIYAMDNTCPHWGGPLGQGVIENGKL